MATRKLAVGLLCTACLALQAPIARAQVFDQSFGDFVAGSVGDAINAAHRARASMNEFNNEIAAARRSFQQCGGTCAQKDQIAAYFDGLLMSKDYHYAIMDFLAGGMAGFGSTPHFDLTQMILGSADGGMPRYAGATFNLWLSCLRRGKQMGLFIEFPGAEAFVNCTDNYLAHRERRNLWEFYQIPGVLDALAASGARAAGAPLFEEERQVAESDLLPGNVEGLEFLHCVYGPIGSEQDAVLQEFNFWYGEVPFSRVELLKELNWMGPWRKAPSIRIKYLRMPEVARTSCPPGDLNALALNMSQKDSEEFLSVERQRKTAKRAYDMEVQYRIKAAAQKRAEEDREYIRQYNIRAQEPGDIMRADSNACRQKFTTNDPRWRECTNEVQAQYRYALGDLKNRIDNSPKMRKTTNDIEGIGSQQGEIDACQETSDVITRLTTENLARRAFPDSASRLMGQYDFKYEFMFDFTVNAQEQYGALEQCKTKRVQEAKAGIKRTYREIRDDIFHIDMAGGRTSIDEINTLKHNDIADVVMIETAWQAIEMLKPEFFEGDPHALSLLRPNDPSVYECLTDPLCPGTMLYVDKVKVANLEKLREIPVPNIKQIEYVPGRDAKGIYGEDHHQGAILVTTAGAN